jgi:sodium/proline symporter
VLDISQYSFLFFLLLTIFVGVISSKKATSNSEDYLLAGRKVHPWVMALSTFSTANSGFMFIAYIGYTYNNGISSLWYLITWIFGELMAWIFIHPKLRTQSEKENLNTLSSFIAGPNPEKKSNLVKVTAITSFIFLGIYAAAQLKVANKALFILTDWDKSTGIIIAGIIMAIYCFSGGIRASIWTDVVQTFLMLGAMFTIFALTMFHVGGPFDLISTLREIDPSLLKWVPDKWQGHFGVLILSLIVNGFGVIGQPHIMVRVMAINDAKNLVQARFIYLITYILFGLASWTIGLSSRILIPNLTSQKAELALPILAEDLLPAILLGMVLAAALGPLLFMRCFGINFSEKSALISLILASLTVLLWRYVFGLSAYLNEVLPGVLISFFSLFFFKMIWPKKSSAASGSRQAKDLKNY